MAIICVYLYLTAFVCDLTGRFSISYSYVGLRMPEKTVCSRRRDSCPHRNILIYNSANIVKIILSNQLLIKSYIKIKPPDEKSDGLYSNQKVLNF